MAISDMVYKQVTILDGQSLDIVPSVFGHEWVIHNINIPFGKTCEFYHTDGTNEIKIMNLSTSLLSYNFHVNTSSYYSVKNISGSPINVSYDGVIMNE